MKKYTFLFISVLFALAAQAQVPQLMNYQGVARDNNGNILASQAAALRITLHSGSGTGPAVYQETHAVTTNNFGLFNIMIGGGSVVSGTFSTISWGTNTYYVQTELDASGGSNYQDLGASQLLSVPYALYSKNAFVSESGPQGPQGLPGVGGCDPNNRDSLIVLYNNATAYGFYQDANGTGNWLTQALNNTGHSGIASKRSVVLYDNASAYAFYLDNSGNGHWAVTSVGNTNHTSVSSRSIAIIYNNATGYAFYVNNSGVGTWVTQNIGNTNHSHLTHGDKIVIYNNSNAYSFSVDNNGNGTWITQAIGNTGHTVITTE